MFFFQSKGEPLAGPKKIAGGDGAVTSFVPLEAAFGAVSPAPLLLLFPPQFSGGTSCPFGAIRFHTPLVCGGRPVFPPAAPFSRFKGAAVPLWNSPLGVRANAACPCKTVVTSGPVGRLPWEINVPASARADNRFAPANPALPEKPEAAGHDRARPPRPAEGAAAGQCGGHWPCGRNGRKGSSPCGERERAAHPGGAFGGHFSSAGVSGWASALCVSGWASPLWAASLACSSSSRTR